MANSVLPAGTSLQAHHIYPLIPDLVILRKYTKQYTSRHRKSGVPVTICYIMHISNCVSPTLKKEGTNNPCICLPYYRSCSICFLRELFNFQTDALNFSKLNSKSHLSYFHPNLKKDKHWLLPLENAHEVSSLLLEQLCNQYFQQMQLQSLHFCKSPWLIRLPEKIPNRFHSYLHLTRKILYTVGYV